MRLKPELEIELVIAFQGNQVLLKISGDVVTGIAEKNEGGRERERESECGREKRRGGEREMGR